MSSPREYNYTLDVSFYASPGDAEDMIQNIVDAISFEGGEIDSTSPFSTNPEPEDCECCGAPCWEDEMEACQSCQASICGGCMIRYNGLCVDCDEDDSDSDD